MRILAFDFSSPQRSVAVIELPAPAKPGDRTERSRVLSEVDEAGERTTRALGMIEEALRQARIEREQIECLAIGLGPGSYTGVRAGIAVAQGWQLAAGARGTRLLGLSTAEALAVQAQLDGLAGNIAVVIDAQRGEFYLAEYEIGKEGWRETAPLKLASLAEARDREKQVAALVGPEVTRWFPNGRTLFPRASSLGRLAAGRSDFIPGEKLEPIYLRETTFVKAPPVRPAR